MREETKMNQHIILGWWTNVRQQPTSLRSTLVSPYDCSLYLTPIKISDSSNVLVCRTVPDLPRHPSVPEVYGILHQPNIPLLICIFNIQNRHARQIIEVLMVGGIQLPSIIFTDGLPTGWRPMLSYHIFDLSLYHSSQQCQDIPQFLLYISLLRRWI